MAELKRRTLLLASGRQVKLFGSSIAISRSLEIGEGYAPNIFSCMEADTGSKQEASVSNPHRLNQEELMELADFNIRLWLDFKDALRKHGVTSSKLFNREGMR